MTDVSYYPMVLQDPHSSKRWSTLSHSAYLFLVSNWLLRMGTTWKQFAVFKRIMITHPLVHEAHRRSSQLSGRWQSLQIPCPDIRHMYCIATSITMPKQVTFFDIRPTLGDLRLFDEARLHRFLPSTGDIPNYRKRV